MKAPQCPRVHQALRFTRVCQALEELLAVELNASLPCVHLCTAVCQRLATRSVVGDMLSSFHGSMRGRGALRSLIDVTYVQRAPRLRASRVYGPRLAGSRLSGLGQRRASRTRATLCLHSCSRAFFRTRSRATTRPRWTSLLW